MTFSAVFDESTTTNLPLRPYIYLTDGTLVFQPSSNPASAGSFFGLRSKIRRRPHARRRCQWPLAEPRALSAVKTGPSVFLDDLANQVATTTSFAFPERAIRSIPIARQQPPYPSLADGRMHSSCYPTFNDLEEGFDAGCAAAVRNGSDRVAGTRPRGESADRLAGRAVDSIGMQRDSQLPWKYARSRWRIDVLGPDPKSPANRER